MSLPRQQQGLPRVLLCMVFRCLKVYELAPLRGVSRGFNEMLSDTIGVARVVLDEPIRAALAARPTAWACLSRFIQQQASTIVAFKSSFQIPWQVPSAFDACSYPAPPRRPQVPSHDQMQQLVEALTKLESIDMPFDDGDEVNVSCSQLACWLQACQRLKDIRAVNITDAACRHVTAALPAHNCLRRLELSCAKEFATCFGTRISCMLMTRTVAAASLSLQVFELSHAQIPVDMLELLWSSCCRLTSMTCKGLQLQLKSSHALSSSSSPSTSRACTIAQWMKARKPQLTHVWLEFESLPLSGVGSMDARAFDVDAWLEISSRDRPLTVLHIAFAPGIAGGPRFLTEHVHRIRQESGSFLEHLELPNGQSFHVFRKWAEGTRRRRWYCTTIEGVECRPGLTPSSSSSEAGLATH